ncbi:MAG: reprolysin-like metallopeptidase [Ferruginibacter sp.]
MSKIYTGLFSLIILLSTSITLQAQNNFFSDVSERSITGNISNRVIVPLKSRTVSMELSSMKSFLGSLQSENSSSFNRNNAKVLTLPKPDGTAARFKVWESSIQEPALEARFPEIRTFAGQGIDDPYATIRFDITPRGFHAQVLSINGTYYLDPFSLGNTENYISYFRQDLAKSSAWTCDVQDVRKELTTSNFTTAACRGDQLRTYRLAVANTGEYAQAPGIAAGNNPALLHAAIVTSVNRVVGVYEKEVAVRMVLIANNNLVEFLDASTDPFNGNNNANVLINESQAVIDANIGSANYDIGHTFSTGGGGLAQLNSPCGPSKARGITGSPSPTGDAYDIDYVAHEMGHQYGGNHSMNGCGSSPTTTKYEPGSGTTIQAYAGICGAQDIQPNSDPFFHGISFDEISNFVGTTGGSTCGVLSATNNGIPVVGALTPNTSIPVGTPFTLTGTATDPNGDALTYCWEQWDLGNPGASWNIGATAPPGNTAPLFKSRAPKTTGSRTFPDIAVIAANFPANPPPTMNGLKGETLSPVARPMKFRLTVRDNRAGGGGVASSGGDGCQSSVPVVITAVGTAPFAVTTPNGGESYPGNTTQTVTWNVVGTDLAPINVANVKISLSIDGGLTYPTVLLASTPNDGTESVSIPNSATTQARIKVEAIGNIFFDISNQNFSITAATFGFTFNSSTPANVACGVPGSAAVVLGTTSSGGFAVPINLSATAGVPAGTTVTFSANPIAPGTSSTVTLTNTAILAPGTYNITITGVAGTVTQTTTVSYIVTPGAPPVISQQPQSQTICVGANATFSVVAAGTVTYQWQVSTGGGPFTNIAGATSASYTVTGATTAQSGNQYRVVVTALCGTATSNTATLTVNSGPSITSQPAAIAVCSGQNATFSVTATGTNLTYQWQTAASCSLPFSNISGATSSSYTVNAVTPAMNGTAYQVVVTSSCGPVTSNCVVLTVNNPVVISTQPASTSVCLPASNVSFSVTATGTATTYQWQVSTNGGANFTDIAGATSATLNLTPAASLNGNQYRVVLNGTCTTGLISGVATLTVNSPVSITSQPLNTKTCVGDPATLSVTATSSSPQFITYQWQVSVNGGTFVNIPGETSSSLSVAGLNTNNGNVYRVIVSGPPCGSVTSNSATFTVNQKPVATISVSGPTSVNPSVRTSITASVSPAGASYTYRWFKDGVLVPGLTTPTITVDVDGIGSYTVQVTDNTTGCFSSSNNVAISYSESAPNVLFIYPNPSNGTFQVRNFSVVATSNAQMITIYDSKGALVYQKRYPVTRLYERMNVDMLNATSGIYLLELRDASGKRIASSRIMVQK